MRGGATRSSAVNRRRSRNGVAIPGTLAPIVIHLMLEAPGQVWGELSYPVVE